MKVKIVAIFIASALLFSLSCSPKQEAEIQKTEVATENRATLHLAVEGMVCASGCAKGIEKELSTVNGIVSCEVDFESESATVIYDKSKLEERDIIALIEDINEGQYTATVVSENAVPASADTAKIVSSANTTEKMGGFDGTKPKTEFILPLLLSYILNNIAG
ncbi:MAG: heavy-metal-associated domain-containing protein [Flavobacteriales bacterium]|nr:heavy-metal-associated domain-containing protein [Flavobacteriales bacterium]